LHTCYNEITYSRKLLQDVIRKWQKENRKTKEDTARHTKRRSGDDGHGLERQDDCCQRSCQLQMYHPPMIHTEPEEQNLCPSKHITTMSKRCWNRTQKLYQSNTAIRLQVRLLHPTASTASANAIMHCSEEFTPKPKLNLRYDNRVHKFMKLQPSLASWHFSNHCCLLQNDFHSPLDVAMVNILSQIVMCDGFLLT